MARFRGAALHGLMVQARHAETCLDWHPITSADMPPPSRAKLLRRKTDLEGAAAELGLRISVWPDPEAVAAAFGEIIAGLKLIERDLAASVCAS